MSRISDIQDIVDAGGDAAAISAAADKLNIMDGSMVSNELANAIIVAKGGVSRIQEPKDVQSNSGFVPVVDTNADGIPDSIDTDGDGRADKDDYAPLDPEVQDAPAED